MVVFIIFDLNLHTGSLWLCCESHLSCLAIAQAAETVTVKPALTHVCAAWLALNTQPGWQPSLLTWKPLDKSQILKGACPSGLIYENESQSNGRTCSRYVGQRTADENTAQSCIKCNMWPPAVLVFFSLLSRVCHYYITCCALNIFYCQLTSWPHPHEIFY